MSVGNGPPAAGRDEDATMVIEHPAQLWKPETRRGFLRLLGIGGSVVFLPSVLTACGDDDDPIGPGTGGAVALNLSTDTWILNYAYALEQLEAAFYQAVVASAAFGGMTAEQREVLVDLRNHEVIHREFFRQAIGNARIGNLVLDTAAVGSTVSSAANILRNAEAFEDLGVAAYNGAGKYLTSAAFLTIAGKIVSVEARHAAAIRDLREAAGISTGTPAGTRFAGDDVVVPSGTYAGLDVKLEPAAVLGRVVATGVVETQVSIGTAPPMKNGTPDFGPPSPTP